MTKITTIITSYNHADTICRAVDSVLAQRGLFEHQVIVIDDGSTDGTVGLLANYGGRVTLYYNNHAGMMNTFIFGLLLADGEFIAFCDCDDWWTDKDKLEMQLHYMMISPSCGLCVTKAQTLHNGVLHGMERPSITFDTLLRGTAGIHAQTYFVRKSMLFKYVDFDRYRKFRVWDYPIVLELINHCEFHCVGVYTAVYNRQTESVTRTQSRRSRFNYLMGNYRIKWHYIVKYGCKLTTLLYLIYRLTRDVYSIIFKRWTK